MYKSIITAAAVALVGMVGSAQAATLATLGGTFSVRAVNVTNVNSTQSQATFSNFNKATLGTLGTGVGPLASVYSEERFTYTGDLNFITTAGAGTKISDWLATGKGLGGVGNGAVTGLDASFGGLQQSKGVIGAGTATSTFYFFQLVGSLSAGDFSVRHDDGIALFDDAVKRGDSVGPNTVLTTDINGFDGGKFSLLYVATNSDPSILKVDTTGTVAPIPVPAPLALLASALVGLGVLRRRRAAA